MSTIFISYRRLDSEHFSARLHEGLEETLGIGEVFLDTENLEGAEDWKNRLKEEIEVASLVIVVIGKLWLEEITKRRNLSEQDQVLWEIQTAIMLNKPIIPLLISGATMPKADELPEAICTFPRSNAISFQTTKSDEFHRVLTQILGILSKTQPFHESERSKGLRRFLDPTLDLFSRYSNQDHLIEVTGREGQPFKIPAVALLNAADIPDPEEVMIEYVDDHFDATAGSLSALEEYTRDATGRKKSFYNDETARLADLRYDGRITLVFQPTSYFESVKTNMAMDFDDGLHGCLRDEVHPDGRLEALSESCLANHVGINGLVFSNDGFMVFQRRSAKVFTNPNQLCPGFSGAIKLADIKNRRSGIENLAEMDIFREMFEELGIKEKMITQHRFLGLSRELLRGGKPEMFFGVELAMCAADIQKCMSITKEKEGDIFLLETRNDRVYLSEQQSKRLSDRFESLVIKMETDANARASLPLLTNLAFWVNQNQAPKILMPQNKL